MEVVFLLTDEEANLMLPQDIQPHLALAVIAGPAVTMANVYGIDIALGGISQQAVYFRVFMARGSMFAAAVPARDPAAEGRDVVYGFLALGDQALPLLGLAIR